MIFIKKICKTGLLTVYFTMLPKEFLPDELDIFTIKNELIGNLMAKGQAAETSFARLAVMPETVHSI
jgi:hypothetical protein